MYLSIKIYLALFTQFNSSKLKIIKIYWEKLLRASPFKISNILHLAYLGCDMLFFWPTFVKQCNRFFYVDSSKVSAFFFFILFLYLPQAGKRPVQLVSEIDLTLFRQFKCSKLDHVKTYSHAFKMTDILRFLGRDRPFFWPKFVEQYVYFSLHWPLFRIRTQFWILCENLFFEFRVRTYFWIPCVDLFLNPEWEPVFEFCVRIYFRIPCENVFWIPNENLFWILCENLV